jgi:hypothetical protein
MAYSLKRDQGEALWTTHLKSLGFIPNVLSAADVAGSGRIWPDGDYQHECSHCEGGYQLTRKLVTPTEHESLKKQDLLTEEEKPIPQEADDCPF